MAVRILFLILPLPVFWVLFDQQVNHMPANPSLGMTLTKILRSFHGNPGSVPVKMDGIILIYERGEKASGSIQICERYSIRTDLVLFSGVSLDVTSLEDGW